MIYYIDTMLEVFPYEAKKQSKSPWNDKSFKVNKSVKRIDKARKSFVYTSVTKSMFLCKRARSDVEPAVSCVSTRTSKPNESN